MECTCIVVPPRRESALGSVYGRAVYVDEVHDDTQFDPACPFHGKDGTMVAVISTPSRRSACDAG